MVRGLSGFVLEIVLVEDGVYEFDDEFFGGSFAFGGEGSGDFGLKVGPFLLGFEGAELGK